MRLPPSECKHEPFCIWMKCRKEGKLLARAAGLFNHPGEAEQIKEKAR